MPNQGKVKITHPERCKGCEICVMYCPTDVLKVKKGQITITDIDSCVGCYNCELSCPDFVLEVVEEDEK